MDMTVEGKKNDYDGAVANTAPHNEV